jgi:hypothetical protein
MAVVFGSSMMGASKITVDEWNDNKNFLKKLKKEGTTKHKWLTSLEFKLSKGNSTIIMWNVELDKVDPKSEDFKKLVTILPGILPR